MNISSTRCMNAVILLVIVCIFVILPSHPSFVHGKEYDFGKVQDKSGTSSGRSRQPSKAINITEDVEVLWETKAPYLLLELGSLKDQLLWVVSDKRNVHVTLGRGASFYPGNKTQKVPGMVINLNVHSLKHMPKTALVTVGYKQGNHVNTRIYTLRVSNGDQINISTFSNFEYQLIRPVGPYLYRQQFDVSVIWKTIIHKMHTKGKSLEKGKKFGGPEKGRLSSLEHLYGNRFATIDSEGNLIVFVPDKHGKRLPAGFGRGLTNFSSLTEQSRNRESTGEPLRLPPAYSSRKQLLSVIKNPPVKNSMDDWINNATSNSFIYLFDEKSLGFVGEIGPFSHPVFDVEVPPQNPNQLLWFRRKGNQKTVLEMVDLDKAFPNR
ncbi:MAG: hypothetical protein ABEJ65_04960 [bacterium]